tara:strand:- start:19 stop:396 length:378 start_codon:yes stop_codon:yes gene_type:complete
MKDNFVDKLKFDDHGLIAVVVQDNATNEVLTLAYMNDEALKKTIETGKTWFWRRSKERLMMKGSTSGHVQLVKDILIDCDADALIIKVKQIDDVACHEGYRSCFFRTINAEGNLQIVGERLIDPD